MKLNFILAISALLVVFGAFADTKKNDNEWRTLDADNTVLHAATRKNRDRTCTAIFSKAC
jgi:hypothetical protein